MSGVGLLKGILDNTPLKGLGLTPQLTEKEIVIELSDAQLKELLLEKSDDRAKNAVSVHCKEGKLVLTIRLF